MTPTAQNHLRDAYQRKITYLRLSVTDRCNLRCRYCAPALPKPLQHRKLLSLDEMLRLVRIAAGLGIRKVRLTGGEPLCRSGLAGFIGQLNQLSQLQDISITTNATMLGDRLDALTHAGLRRINISLDTLDRLKYHRLTGADRFDDVWHGIMAAADAGLAPIKINTVIMKGVNDDEIEALAQLARRFAFHIRFIEYMPIGTDPSDARRFFYGVDDILARLRRMGTLLPVAASGIDGPAKRYRFAGSPGEIGLIGSMSRHFCGTCNRLRLTAAGQLRPCLLADDQVDIMSVLRSGCTDEALTSLFMRTMGLKKAQHRLQFSGGSRLQSKMVMIGG